MRREMTFEQASVRVASSVGPTAINKQELIELLQQLDEAMVGETQLAVIERMKEITRGLINTSDVFIKIARKLESQPPPTVPVLFPISDEKWAVLEKTHEKGAGALRRVTSGLVRAETFK
jgi:hypothetical protein